MKVNKPNTKTKDLYKIFKNHIKDGKINALIFKNLKGDGEINRIKLELIEICTKDFNKYELDLIKNTEDVKQIPMVKLREKNNKYQQIRENNLYPYKLRQILE